MKYSRTLKSSALAFVMGLAVVCVTPALASDTACLTTQTLTATTPTIIGAGNGCTSGNSNFQVFGVSGGTGSFPTVTGGGSAGIQFPGTTIGTAPYTLDFETGAQDAAGTGATCTGQTWCVAGANGNDTQSITYYAQATGGHDYYDLGLTVGTLQLGTDILSGDVVTLEEMFCLGATSVTVGTGGCTQANSGYLKVTETSNGTATYTNLYQVCVPGVAACTLGTVATAPAYAFSGQTLIAIDDTITITTTGTEARTEFLDSFDNTFSESPEPSTFVLFGSALAGLGFLRARGRKA